MKTLGRERGAAWVRGIGLGLALLVASAASAKDVCVLSSGGTGMIFKSVAPLKPGKVAALKGIATSGAQAAPLTGSAIMRPGGTVEIGVFVHGLNTIGVNETFEWTADATFAGTGGIDADGDYVSDNARIFTVLDCKTFVVP